MDWKADKQRLRELPQVTALTAATSCQPSCCFLGSELTSFLKLLLGFSITWENEKNVQFSQWRVWHPEGVGGPGQSRTSQERPGQRSV